MSMVTHVVKDYESETLKVLGSSNALFCPTGGFQVPKSPWLHF
jgi:hypothetical protein